MKEKNKKLKVWFDEHKNEIKTEAIRITYYALGLGIGYFVGDKICGHRMNSGLMIIHNAGIIKFFNPSTGLEVDYKDAVSIIDQFSK